MLGMRRRDKLGVNGWIIGLFIEIVENEKGIEC